MPKRKLARTKSTKDVGSSVLQSYTVSHLNVTTKFKSTEFNLPLLNLPNRSPSDYLAIEIHKVEVFQADDAGTHHTYWALASNTLDGVATTTASAAATSVDPRTIVSGSIAKEEAYSLFDLTDDTNNGLLYPNQKLYITTSNYSGTGTTVVKFWYKVVHVSQSMYLAMMNNYFLLG